MPGKGIFFSISDELNEEFHLILEKRMGRKIKRGDLTKAGADALKMWMSA